MNEYEVNQIDSVGMFKDILAVIVIEVEMSIFYSRMTIFGYRSIVGIGFGYSISEGMAVWG